MLDIVGKSVMQHLHKILWGIQDIVTLAQLNLFVFHDCKYERQKVKNAKIIGNFEKRFGYLFFPRNLNISVSQNIKDIFMIVMLPYLRFKKYLVNG